MPVVKSPAELLWKKFQTPSPTDYITFGRQTKKSVRTSSHIIQPTFVLHFAGSIYTTLALAVERYISVCHPHHVGFEHAGIMSIAGLITFSVVFNTGRFLEFETVYDNAVSILHIN